VLCSKQAGAAVKVHAASDEVSLRAKILSSHLPTRAQNMANMKERTFDLLVIGGGATGTGVALDSVSRGMNVWSVGDRGRCYWDGGRPRLCQ